MKYGYMDAPHPGSKSANLLSRDGLKEYIMEFQAFGGLNMTGELDKETIALMSMPRYGLHTTETDRNKKEISQKAYLRRYKGLFLKAGYHVYRLSAVSWRSTPTLPHLRELWALEAPVGTLVHKTIYAPMIYTALSVMF